MRLRLLRHTRPLIAAGICYGQTDVDVSTEDCRSFAAFAGQLFPAGLPVFSSPLQRCARLAQLLQPHRQPYYDARLMELNFGHWEMRAWDDIPRADIDAWAAAPASYQPGGGESAIDVAGRVISWLADLRQLAVPDAIVVSHAGIMRMLLAWQEGMQAEQLASVVCQQNLVLSYAEIREILVF